MIIYADDLKNTHELTLSGVLDVSQPPPSSDVKQGPGFGTILLLLPILGGAMVIAALVIRRRQGGSSKGL